VPLLTVCLVLQSLKAALRSKTWKRSSPSYKAWNALMTWVSLGPWLVTRCTLGHVCLMLQHGLLPLYRNRGNTACYFGGMRAHLAAHPIVWFCRV
jgi:hypothetical protein